MTQEDKNLLFKDLCARLPYDVKGLVAFHKNMAEIQEEIRIIDGKLYDRFAKFQDSWYDNVTIKPYLFPMSSMTDEQKDFYWNHGIDFGDAWTEVDWLNKNHIDYRGLIEKGLAIDATCMNIY